MTAFLVSPEDDIIGRYKKRTLLPFGEYVPGESWFPAVREWFTLHEIMYAGDDPRPLKTVDDKQLGMLICYEDTLPRSARQTVAAGAQALFSLIQGTAFHNPLTLRQHMRLAAMRAVENRRYFVRCASTGVTCIIDPTGRVVSQLPVQTEGTLVGEIALIDSQSLYTRIGDLFPWCCTAVVAAALWFGRRKRAARKSD
jgi:apolipoprotein N-acyltransferase